MDSINRVIRRKRDGGGYRKVDSVLMVEEPAPSTRNWSKSSRWRSSLPENRNLDGRGNYTLGITEQIIFPEINYDRIDKIRGMNITIVTTAQNDEEGKALLKHLGMPFRN